MTKRSKLGVAPRRRFKAIAAALGLALTITTGVIGVSAWMNSAPHVEMRAVEGPAYDRLGIDAYIVNTGGSAVTVSSVEFLDLTVLYAIPGAYFPIFGTFDYVRADGASLLCRFEPATLDADGMPVAFAMITKRMFWSDGTRVWTAPPGRPIIAHVRVTFFDRPPEILEVPVSTHDPKVRSLETPVMAAYQKCWRDEETNLDLVIPDSFRAH